MSKYRNFVIDFPGDRSRDRRTLIIPADNFLSLLIFPHSSRPFFLSPSHEYSNETPTMQADHFRFRDQHIPTARDCDQVTDTFQPC